MDILMYVLFILCLPPSITLCTNQLSEPTLTRAKFYNPDFKLQVRISSSRMGEPCCYFWDPLTSLDQYFPERGLHLAL